MAQAQKKMVNVQAVAPIVQAETPKEQTAAPNVQTALITGEIGSKATISSNKEGTRDYRVWDSSAVDKNTPRVHDIIYDGGIEHVSFLAGKPTLLPIGKALKFLKEGFIVKDFNGNLVSQPKETPLSTSLELGHDYVIARIDELTQEALFFRAVNLAGGEEFSETTRSDKLIEFLKSHAIKKIKDNAPLTEEGDEMSAAELDALGLTND